MTTRKQDALDTLLATPRFFVCKTFMRSNGKRTWGIFDNKLCKVTIDGFNSKREALDVMRDSNKAVR